MRGGGGGGSRIVYAAVAKSERFIYLLSLSEAKKEKKKKRKKRRSGVSRVGLTSPCSPPPPPATVAAFHCTQFTDWSPVGGRGAKNPTTKKKKAKPNPPTKAACSNRLLPKGCHGNSGGRGTRCPL